MSKLCKIIDAVNNLIELPFDGLPVDEVEPWALEYVNKAISMQQDAPFYMLRMKSLIQAKLGDKKGAIATAKESLRKSEEAKNDDYVKMNKDSILEWSK